MRAIQCPHCEEVTQLPDDWPNLKFLCPSCNAAVGMPHPRSDTTPTSTRAQPSQPRPTLEDAGYLFLIIIFGAFILWVVADGNRLPTPPPSGTAKANEALKSPRPEAWMPKGTTLEPIPPKTTPNLEPINPPPQVATQPDPPPLTIRGRWKMTYYEAKGELIPIEGDHFWEFDETTVTTSIPKEGKFTHRWNADTGASPARIRFGKIGGDTQLLGIFQVTAEQLKIALGPRGGYPSHFYSDAKDDHLYFGFVPAPKEAKQEDKVAEQKRALQGIWEPESVVFGGDKVSKSDWVHLAWQFNGEELLITLSPLRKGGKSTTASWTFSIDPNKDPAHLDITKDGSQLGFIAVYKLEGDTLTVVWNAGRETRPSKLETTKADVFTLTVMKRKK
jgi:uncharacterized protein (TIGR03067 family)